MASRRYVQLGAHSGLSKTHGLRLGGVLTCLESTRRADVTHLRLIDAAPPPDRAYEDKDEKRKMLDQTCRPCNREWAQLLLHALPVLPQC